MTDPLLVGVDGGGTGCRARVRRLDGSLVGEASGGTANVFAGLDAALATILGVIRNALTQGGLGEADLSRAYVGFGLAGANVASVSEAFRASALPYAGYGLESDAVTACRGAFAGGDGAIAILGTGSAFCVRASESFTLLGGWGMLVSDGGSGADLGRRALALALLAFDGVVTRDPLADALLARFDERPDRIAEWAKDARPRDFAALAPLVFSRFEAGDESARRLVDQSIADIEPMLRRLVALGAPAIALLGGLGPLYRPLLDRNLPLVEAAGDAMEGGIDLARSVLGAVQQEER